MGQLTFHEVCKTLKNDNNYKSVTEAINIISGAAILLQAGRAASGDISAFVNALAVKDELINAGKHILEKIIKGKSNEYEKRMNQMKWAYAMIYYTAYFDVLDEKLPKEIREAIALSAEEKKALFCGEEGNNRNKEKNLSDASIFFPNIVYGYVEVGKHLTDLYNSMSKGLEEFVHKLSFEETAEEHRVAEFHAIAVELPKLAVKKFWEQYLCLAETFPEFYIYTQIEKEKVNEAHMEERFQGILSAVQGNSNELDVGFAHLEQVMLTLNETIQKERVKEIAKELSTAYKRAVQKPIIEVKSDDEKLTYPSIEDAFIPQSYKTLMYSGKEPLEQAATWEQQEPCLDMDQFWAAYCLSSYSVESLLLILGEPGGGKSLLTKMICAKMSSTDCVYVRIPLRDVSVENDIEKIVCEQIGKDGDAWEPLTSFKWFAEEYKYNPITLVFDGYDEVLQATGRVYGSLLEKIRDFQIKCFERHRPVRIVVTSRDNLIDKATIPVGTVVLKLLEFNEGQRNSWIEIWNRSNAEIFKEEHLRPFALPLQNENIEALSRQPLLLLMLAIYDADFEKGTNALGKEKILNRTKLYDELLKRFVRRELRKGARGGELSFADSDEERRQNMVKQEMEKLGIAALGMFIRGELSISVTELEDDFHYMEAGTSTDEKMVGRLSDEEKFFGSFLFIHDSMSGTDASDDKRVAFEFLHKTFYEFLVADLILNYINRNLKELIIFKENKMAESYQKTLTDPERLDRQYYTSLMCAYLCEEPMIVEMMLEWKETVIQACYPNKRQLYDEILKDLFVKQTELLRTSVFCPKVFCDNNSHENLARKSYMQCCATYFLNLLTVQIVTSSENHLIIQEQDWHYIAQFWKTNIPEEMLLLFTAQFEIKKTATGVRVSKKTYLETEEQKSQLQKRLELSNFLQDDMSYNMYQLHDVGASYKTKQECRKELYENKIDVEFEMCLEELKEYIFRGASHDRVLIDNMEKASNLLSFQVVDATLVWEWLLCLKKCWNIARERKYGTEDFRRVFQTRIIDTIWKHYRNEPDIIRLLWEIYRERDAIISPGVIDISGSFLRRMMEEDLYYVDWAGNILKYTKTWEDVFISLKWLLKVIPECKIVDSVREYALRCKSGRKDASLECQIELLNICIMLAGENASFERFNPEIMYFMEIWNNRDFEWKSVSLTDLPEAAFLTLVMLNQEFEKKLRSLYRKILDIKPERAARLLIKMQELVQMGKFRTLTKDTMIYFSVIAMKSPETAFKLLLLASDFEVKFSDELMWWITDYLYEFTTVDVDMETLQTLLSRLDESERAAVESTLAYKYSHIVLASPNLAIILAKVCRNSKRKEVFTRSLEFCRKILHLDGSYIDRLEELWN